jgi:hypothetical protein
MVVMLDEIATERRARYDNRTNMVVGVCREHALLNVGGCDGCGKLITSVRKKGARLAGFVQLVNSYKFNLHLTKKLQFHGECTNGLKAAKKLGL